jgi:hypothetical protein
MPNKRIQRMAWALSNEEVARSTAEAPNVRRIELVPERETDDS